MTHTVPDAEAKVLVTGKGGRQTVPDPERGIKNAEVPSCAWEQRGRPHREMTQERVARTVAKGKGIEGQGVVAEPVNGPLRSLSRASPVSLGCDPVLFRHSADNGMQPPFTRMEEKTCEWNKCPKAITLSTDKVLTVALMSSSSGHLLPLACCPALGP